MNSGVAHPPSGLPGNQRTTQATIHYLSLFYPESVNHSLLVTLAAGWLRRKYRCGIVLAEQYRHIGETPDAIGWKGNCHSVVIECKTSRADFLADLKKSCRQLPGAMGCERFYLVPAGLVTAAELPPGWGLLEHKSREISLSARSKKNLRSEAGLFREMNLLLASLRRVELRIEPQSITDFLKWKNRLAQYNGGAYPGELLPPEKEDNLYRQ